ncbi:MAG: 5'-nucleotidase C-terminal domain-containing protein [Nitrospirae bacterium]|nr:5'-nucleotidase C-terminal domain-containing protein [Nitrospirota bacterium]
MKNLLIRISLVIILILSVTSADAEQTDARILYMNDFHGFAEPHRPLGSDELMGGISYLAKRVAELRRERPSLLLAAGDMIQGNNWANLSLGESVIEVMNLMRFDAMAAGNHEFDFGRAVLRERISQAAFPILGANVAGLDLLRPYVIRAVDGVKIGIIGLVTEDAPVATHPKNVEGLRFLPVIETAERYVRELRGRADVVLILSHAGHHIDRMLAERVRGIDIIVGGHTHTKVLKPVVAGNTIIVQAWEHGKALGVLDVSIDNGKIIAFEGRLEEIRPVQGREDHAVAEVVQKYGQRVDAVLNEEIGVSKVELDGENVRLGETNLGNLIADIMMAASGADATIINGGGIRTGLKKGILRAKDIYSVLPFDNYIVAVRLTGKEIRGALEHGVSGVENAEGRFPQVSGITFQYGRSLPAGSRITEVMISGKPIDESKEYTVATNDFLAAGGDGYRAFGDAGKASKNFEIAGGMMKGERLVYSDSGRWLRDVVIEYIKGKKVISPSVEGRIRELR